MRIFFLICYLVAGLCWLICTVGHFAFGRAATDGGRQLNVGWLLPFGLVWFSMPFIISAGMTLD